MAGDMRCPDCNKFASYNEADPEVQDDSPPVEEGGVTAEVRIVNECADCGTELTEATFDTQADFDEQIVKAHTGDGHELTASIDDAQRTTQSGKGRRAPVYYGFEATAVLRCSCQANGDAPLQTVSVEDNIQASHMDSLV